MAGVRPAGSTESWQSWMDSLAKQTEESVNTPESGETAATTDSTPNAPAGVPAELTPEAFDAVEQEAMTAKIGGDDEEEFEEDATDEETEVHSEFDRDESQAARPWSSIDAPAVSAATAHAPDFESAPGFQWDAPATAKREDAAREASWTTPERSAAAEPARTEPEPSLMDRGAMPPTPAKASEPAPVGQEPNTPRPASAPVTPEPNAAKAAPAPVAQEPAAPKPAPEPVATYATPKPRVAPIPAPTTPVAPLPMRLRERIEAAERAEAEQRGGATGWLIGAAVVAVIAVGVFFTMRARNHAKPAAKPTSVATPATTEPATTPATGTATPPASTTPVPGEGHSAPMAAPPAAVVPKPTPSAAKPAPAKPAATTATTTAAAAKPAGEAPKHSESVKPTETAKPAAAAATPAKPAVAKARYGVSVGSFLAEERAQSESTRLAAATGFPGRVVAGSDGDFHVVLGAFPDRAAAEKAAGGLINGGKVEEARVVPLK